MSMTGNYEGSREWLIEQNEALKARVAELEAQRVKHFMVQGGSEPVQLIQFAKKVGIRVRYDSSVRTWHFGEGDE